MKKAFLTVAGLAALAFAGAALASTTLYYKHVTVTPGSSVCSHTTPPGTLAANKFADSHCTDHSSGNGNSWHYTLIVTPATTTTTCTTTASGATSGPYSDSNCTHVYTAPSGGDNQGGDNKGGDDGHHGDGGHDGCDSWHGYGECGPPPPPDACRNIEGYQSSVPKGYTANSDHVCTPIPPVIVPPAPELPNAVAFCYGKGANSYMMITPTQFGHLTKDLLLTVTYDPTTKTFTSTYAPAWTYGAMASWNETTGTFTCLPGLSYTGRYFDTTGENVTAGEPIAAANWGKTVVDANGNPQTPEWYPGVK